MKKYSLIIVFVLLFYLSPIKSLASKNLDIVINEIAWMGTTTSANDEWIELYNNTQNPINLDGWILRTGDGTPEIKLSGIILAEGFYLLEKTDDNTVPEIPADLIYKGALSNDGEDLKLFDNSGNLIDETNCSSGWFAGDNSTKQTMEKTSAGWQTSKEPAGTPKAKNSEQNQELRIAEVKPLLTYASGIVFNEILPSPEGPDETEEWIEIFNQNNFEVELSEWKIKDHKGKITTYTFPPDTKISPLGYLVLLRPETKITLNNDGDGLSLIYPNGEIADSITFEKAPLGQSYNKTPSDWTWSNNLTPGAKNIISSPQNKQEPFLTKKTEKTEDRPQNIEKQEANIALSSKDSNYPVILIALIVAVFSTGAVLILKNI